MIVDIKELFDAPGTSIPLEGEIDLSQVEIWGENIFSSPSIFIILFFEILPISLR